MSPIYVPPIPTAKSISLPMLKIPPPKIIKRVGVHLEPRKKLDFSDVLIKPQFSSVASRKDVKLSRTFKFQGANSEWSGVPLCTSNMDTIGTVNMFKVLTKYNILTCFSKHIDIPNVIHTLQSFNNVPQCNFMYTIGLRDKHYRTLEQYEEQDPPQFLCLDVANGYTKEFRNFVDTIREKFPNVVLCVGNVVTPEIVSELVKKHGCDIVKIGIGSGSVCTTRLKTGIGFPQLSAILECADAAHDNGGYIMSDGGITNSGDICKALVAGADFIMLGSLLAGHAECLGNLYEDDGVTKMKYYGMASQTALDTYHGFKDNKYRAAEGKTVDVLYKGLVANTIEDILGGIRSCCTYVGSSNIEDLQSNKELIIVNNQVNNTYN